MFFSGKTWAKVGLSIGSTLGQLIGINTIEQGVLRYQFTKPSERDDELIEAVFGQNEEGPFLFNPSNNTKNNIVMSFPSNERLGKTTKIISGLERLYLGDLFKEIALLDNSCFDLIACRAQEEIRGRYLQKIIQTGCDILVGDGLFHPIGQYLTVCIREHEITIQPLRIRGELRLIPLVLVSGSGDTKYQISNITIQDNQEITIPFPSPLVKGDYVGIEIYAEVIDTLEDRTQSRFQCSVVSQDIAERIRNAKTLNSRCQ